jgi:hypothetical protein
VIADQASSPPASVHAAIPRAGPWQFITRLENTVALTVLAVMTLVPFVEVADRLGSAVGVSGAIVLVQHPSRR